MEKSKSEKTPRVKKMKKKVIKTQPKEERNSSILSRKEKMPCQK